MTTNLSSKQGTIIINSDYGLCNRMRAIGSAISFGQNHDKKIKVVWLSNEELNCSFFDLFKPIEGVEIYNSIPFIYKKNHRFCQHFLNTLQIIVADFLYKNNPWFHDVFFKCLPGIFIHFRLDKFKMKRLQLRNYNFDKLSVFKNIYLESFIRFYPSLSSYSLFQPTDWIQVQIDIETKDFNDKTIGMHIRRTDHEFSIRYSPIGLFELVIQHEIQKDPLTKFYIASDSIKTKQYLIDKYENYIITNLEETSRLTTAGMQRALIELYSLSKTRKVYGSKGSSFSHTASDLSGIEEIEVSKESLSHQFAGHNLFAEIN